MLHKSDTVHIMVSGPATLTLVHQIILKQNTVYNNRIQSPTHCGTASHIYSHRKSSILLLYYLSICPNAPEPGGPCGRWPRPTQIFDRVTRPCIWPRRDSLRTRTNKGFDGACCYGRGFGSLVKTSCVTRNPLRCAYLRRLSTGVDAVSDVYSSYSFDCVAT